MRMAQQYSFPELLKNYRQIMGLTQEQLAKAWTYSPDAISAWERGIRTPGSQQIPRIAKLLKTTPEELAKSINGASDKVNKRKSVVVPTIDEEGLAWKSAQETWGEMQNIYRNRTMLNRDFSYAHMFETAHDILVVGVSLNAIALNHSREGIISSVIENKSSYTLCFLNPEGQSCTARGKEEGLPEGTLASLIRLNLVNVENIHADISKRDPESAAHFKIVTYDLPPRMSMYLFDDALMTIQHYSYVRGEDTPCFVLTRQSRSGLFEFYASEARRIVELSKPMSTGT